MQSGFGALAAEVFGAVSTRCTGPGRIRLRKYRRGRYRILPNDSGSAQITSVFGSGRLEKSEWCTWAGATPGEAGQADDATQ